MAKLATTINKIDAKALSNPAKIEKLIQSIESEINIQSDIDANEVKELIKGWKKVEDRIMTPLTAAKKDSYEVYKQDQEQEKAAKNSLKQVKDLLTERFNEYALPRITKQEEEHAATQDQTKRTTKATTTIDTSGLRRQPDKYVIQSIDIDKLDDEYKVITANERKIIDAFKEGKDIKGVKIEVIKGQYK